MKKLFIFAITLILPHIVWAADDNTFGPTQQPETIPYVAPEVTLKEEVCPRVDQLVKDPRTKNWMGPGGWKTTSPSFFNDLTSFVGAQWVGVSVGEIICVYVGPDRAKFPVALYNSKLVPMPTNNEAWSNDKGGYMDCKAKDVQECSFFVQARKPLKNVYDQLDFKKNKSVPKDE